MSYAITNNHPLATYLCIKQNTDNLLIDNHHALIEACGEGFNILVKIFIATGSDINIIKNSFFQGTALMSAALNGHSETVEILLTADANVHDKTDDGWTALMSAALNGHSETVEILLTAGANVHDKTDDGWTALMWAALNGHSETVEILLNAKADVHDKNQ